MTDAIPNYTDEEVQKILDYNQQLIMAIIENQKMGKVDEVET